MTLSTSEEEVELVRSARREWRHYNHKRVSLRPTGERWEECVAHSEWEWC